MLKIKTKILLAGGHAGATAYALIKEIISANKNSEIIWVSPRSLVEGKNVGGTEEITLIGMGIKVLHLNAGKLQRKFTRYTIPSIMKIPVGLVQAMVMVGKYKPDVVLSFGGSVGFPIAFAGWLFKIPVVIHEQTAAAGRANIFSSIFATKITIARPSSFRFFPKNKTIMTGNPIDPQIGKIIVKQKMDNPPVLFITGGHTGSLTINEAIYPILHKLIINFRVIHQTGLADFERASEIKKNLGDRDKGRYQIYSTIDAENWPKVLENADIVISRAGANISAQLMLIKKPSILIPLPNTYMDEQERNADLLVDFGIAEKISQNDLSAESLLNAVIRIRRDWIKIIKSTESKPSPDKTASEQLINILFELAK